MKSILYQSRYFCILCALLALSGPSSGQVTEVRLKSFGYSSQSGAASQAPLLTGADGAFYGTTVYGGNSGKGTVFRLNPDGSGYSLLHSFSANGGDGQTPYAGLIQTADAALYGTTSAGGSNGYGTVFKLNTNGTGYTVLHHFLLGLSDGANPYAGLIQGTDGALYGATPMGGSNFAGTVFKLNTDGSSYTVLRHLAVTNGSNPYAALVQAVDGALYGAANHGGTNGAGTLFKLNSDGSGFSVVHYFNAALDGSGPYAGLIQGRDGGLYGTATTGGTSAQGTVFRVTTNGTNFSVLHAFNNSGAMNPRVPLLQGADGTLYGTTLQLGGTVFKISTNGTGYGLLHTFAGGAGDGRLPYAALVQGSDGALYSTTSAGGSLDQGTVFKLGTNGSAFSVVYSFNVSGGDGTTVFAGPLLGADGVLYGTTGVGGTNGAGTVFRLATNGSGYVILHHFGRSPGEGQNPNAGLLQGRDGALYGVTSSGGLYGAGTIYKLGTNGVGYAVLYHFKTNSLDGQNPYGALLQGADGLLYGTTDYGGASGNGSVFKLDTNGDGYSSFSVTGNPFAGLVQGPDGWLYGVVDQGLQGAVFKINTNGTGLINIHNFGNPTGDGLRPTGRLLVGIDSVLYGTTQQGGTNGVGTVFKLNLDGSGYTQLHHFGAFPGDGSYPYAALSQGGDGALYGLTYDGGASGRGTVFMLNTNGSDYAVLYSFAAAPDGLRPWSGPLTQGSDGSLYGTTSGGGDMNYGTLFRLLVPPRLNLLARRPDRNFQFSLAGLGTHPCRIDVSSNLTTWLPLTNFSFPNGTTQWSDLAATNFSIRFYRAVWLP